MIRSEFTYSKDIFFEFVGLGRAVVFNGEKTYRFSSKKRINKIIERIYNSVHDYYQTVGMNAYELESEDYKLGSIEVMEHVFTRPGFPETMLELRKKHKVSFIELYKLAISKLLIKLDSSILTTYICSEGIERAKKIILNNEAAMIRIIKRELLNELLEKIETPVIIVLEEFHIEYLYEISKYVKGFVIRNAVNKDEIVEFAHAFEIPMVASKDMIKNNNKVIIDNINKKYYVNPKRKIQRVYVEKMGKLLIESDQKAKYKMKHHKYYAPMVDLRYLSLIKNSSFYAGMATYRPEYLFMTKGMLPSKEEFLHIFREIFDAFSDSDIYIQTPDIGDMKTLDFLPNINAYIKNFLYGHGIVFRVFFDALNTVIKERQKQIHIVVPMIRDKIEVMPWKQRIKDIFGKLPKEIQPLFGFQIETETTADYIEDFVKTDFNIIGLDTLSDEILTDYSRYDKIPKKYMMDHLYYYIQIAHQHMRRTGIRMKHLISGNIMRNAEIFRKYFVGGFTHFIVPISMMYIAEDILDNYEKTRGRYIGVAQKRREDKKRKEEEKKNNQK
jgi:hypothetical protein